MLSHFFKPSETANAQVSTPEYKVFDDLAYETISMTDKYKAEDREKNVVYFSLKKQEESMVVIKDGLLYESDGNTLLNTINSNLSGRYGLYALYAIDHRGVFHVMAKENQQNKHSSLLAGGDVICAGYISVTDGLLKVITNESGHYKPKAINLLNAIDVLKSNGVDPDTFGVEYQCNDVLSRSLRTEKHDSASDFIADYTKKNPSVHEDFRRNFSL